MSVDGEILTDLKRLQRQWLERHRGAVTEGTAALVIQGPPGSGCTTALRAVVEAQHVQGVAVQQLTSASWAAAMTPSSDDTVMQVFTADYYSIFGLAPRPTAPAVGSDHNRVSQASAFVVVVVDDIASVRALLIANNALANLDAMLADLAVCGGALLTTSTDDGRGTLPPFMDLFAATLTYKLHAALPPGAARRMLRELDADADDFDWRAPVTKRMLECAVLVHNVATVGLSRSVDIVGHCQSHRGEKELTRRLPTDQGATRLFGLEEMGHRLEMLCRIHCSRVNHGGIGVDDDAIGQHVAAAGRVARVCAATTGVLLHGPSGCGKSALLRQLAARLPMTPFFYVIGSHLYAKYVGESEERLRRVFATARQHQPCILVIEEIDVLAPSRQSAAASSGEESHSSTGLDVTRRMLAALLCEMDGVSANDGVLVIATTNQLRSMDQALLRQGRLETPLYVPPLASAVVYDMCVSSLEGLVEDGALRRALAAEAAAQCGGCSASALRLLLRHAVEQITGDDGTIGALTPTVWSACMQDCRKHLQPPACSGALKVQ